MGEFTSIELFSPTQRAAPVPGWARRARPWGGTGAARRVAEVAYKLQETKILPRRRHTMADELRILEHALNATARDRPIWSDRIARISEACRRLGASVRQLDPRPIHRDFYGDQVLIDGASIYLVDLDLFCLGDPALDIGNFSGHIVEQALRENGDADAFQDRKRAMTERFLELTGDVTHAKAIAGYATLTLARHLYISSRITKRRRTTERLVDLCEQRLGLSSGAQPRIANARGHAYAARPTRAPDGHGQESPV